MLYQAWHRSEWLQYGGRKHDLVVTFATTLPGPLEIGQLLANSCRAAYARFGEVLDVIRKAAVAVATRVREHRNVAALEFHSRCARASIPDPSARRKSQSSVGQH